MSAVSNATLPELITTLKDLLDKALHTVEELENHPLVMNQTLPVQTIVPLRMLAEDPPKVRRAKLYYLRERVGKATRDGADDTKAVEYQDASDGYVF